MCFDSGGVCGKWIIVREGMWERSLVLYSDWKREGISGWDLLVFKINWFGFGVGEMGCVFGGWWWILFGLGVGWMWEWVGISCCGSSVVMGGFNV